MKTVTMPMDEYEALKSLETIKIENLVAENQKLTTEVENLTKDRVVLISRRTIGGGWNKIPELYTIEVSTDDATIKDLWEHLIERRDYWEGEYTKLSTDTAKYKASVWFKLYKFFSKKVKE